MTSKHRDRMIQMLIHTNSRIISEKEAHIIVKLSKAKYKILDGLKRYDDRSKQHQKLDSNQINDFLDKKNAKRNLDT